MPTKTIASVGLALILTVAVSVPAEARGFICGAVQMAHYGITNAKYRMALAWADMQHVAAQPGAVVVQTRRGRALGGGPGGHVSRIVQVVDRCHAVVADDRGQYTRDICRNQVAVVLPGGGEGLRQQRVTAPSVKPRRQHRVQLAVYVTPDRHSFH